MPSKNRVTINLTDEEYRALGALSVRSKVSKALLGRHAICSLLDRTQNDDEQLTLPLTGLKAKQHNSRVYIVRDEENERKNG